MNNSEYDIAVIGGGIIGLATAMRLSQEFPRYRVAVLEKEAGGRAAPDRPQQRRHPRRHLLRPRLPKGQLLLHRRLPAAAVLRRARHRVRDVRQAHRGHRRRRGAAPWRSSSAVAAPRTAPRVCRWSVRSGCVRSSPHAAGVQAVSRPTRASSTTPGSPRPTLRRCARTAPTCSPAPRCAA